MNMLHTLPSPPSCCNTQLLLAGLKHGEAAGQSAAGWLAASELLLEEGGYQGALDAAKQVCIWNTLGAVPGALMPCISA